MIETVNGLRNANVYSPQWLTASGFASEKAPKDGVPIEETMLPSTVVGANNCYKKIAKKGSEEQ